MEIKQQNEIVSLTVSSNDTISSSVSKNNIKDIICNSENWGVGNIYIKTYTWTVLNNEQFKVYSNWSNAPLIFQDINIKVKEVVEIENLSSETVSCNFTINNFNQNYLQKDIQDIGLWVINFLFIIFLYFLPFIYFMYVLKQDKNKKPLETNYIKYD